MVITKENYKKFKPFKVDLIDIEVIDINEFGNVDIIKNGDGYAVSKDFVIIKYGDLFLDLKKEIFEKLFTVKKPKKGKKG